MSPRVEALCDRLFVLEEEERATYDVMRRARYALEAAEHNRLLGHLAEVRRQEYKRALAAWVVARDAQREADQAWWSAAREENLAQA